MYISRELLVATYTIASTRSAMAPAPPLPDGNSYAWPPALTLPGLLVGSEPGQFLGWVETTPLGHFTRSKK